jgi:hypothetical protein
MTTLQTEFEFTLPRGYVDKDGNLHREGLMRLANAKDEILPLQDPRVQRNQAYLIVILLSRVVTRLGDLREVNPAVIESLFASDLDYLQEFYNQINRSGRAVRQVSCPDCEHRFEVELSAAGES